MFREIHEVRQRIVTEGGKQVQQHTISAFNGHCRSAILAKWISHRGRDQIIPAG